MLNCSLGSARAMALTPCGVPATDPRIELSVLRKKGPIILVGSFPLVPSVHDLVLFVEQLG
jgi:hypothetical protein